MDLNIAQIISEEDVYMQLMEGVVLGKVKVDSS